MAFDLVLGQGYMWMVHKTPGSDKWELDMRSYKLWQMLAESICDQGLNPLEVLGWKKTGNQTMPFLDQIKIYGFAFLNFFFLNVMSPLFLDSFSSCT